MRKMNEKGKILDEKWETKYRNELKRLGQEYNDENYFEGTCILENTNFIKTLEDMAGWLILTYETSAIYWVNEWIKDYGENDTFFGFTHIDIKHELEKYIEYDK